MVSVNNSSRGIYVTTKQEHDSKYSPGDPAKILAHTAVAREAKKTSSMANYYFFLLFWMPRSPQMSNKSPETGLSFGNQRKPELPHAIHQTKMPEAA